MLPANKNKAKRNEKYIKFWQLAYELRENTWVQSIVGKLHGSIKDVLREVGRVYGELTKTEPTIRTVAETQKPFLVDSDTIIRKALPRLVQTEERKMWK